MADNPLVKILTALLKHQVKKIAGDETLGIIGQEIAALGGDKVDDQIKSWLGEKTNADELEKAAQSAQSCFREKVTDNEIQQWMISLPLGNLPKVVEAIDELPSSPNESKLENALRESITLTWKKLSPEQVDNAVNSFLSCLRSALLPIEKQTLMVIGRSVLRTEDKVDLLLRWFEQYIITGKSVEIKQLYPEPVETWNLKHPYAMPPNFTGRVEERKMLADWLNKDNENRLFILRALGGFGKSALTWHWLTHDVDSKEWKKVLFWSFYEGDASFERFIEEALKYLRLEVPQGQRPQVDALLKAMGSQKILLIMDGFERALRAYSSMNAAYQGDEADESPSPSGRGARGEGDNTQFDCVNLNAEIFLKHLCSLPNIKSKVLMTTRLTPHAVKPRGEFMLGCREVELTSMQPVDAVEFFHKQKIKGTHTEIEAACAPYGYHPLSLRLLAGRILKDFENPADIVVAQKLKIDGDIIQQKHHVLEVSYNSLPSHEQKLLSTIACFRSPVEFKTIEAIVKDVGATHELPLQDDLHDLVTRGLLHFDEKNKKFDLHPIVRRFAYHCLTTADRADAHERLVNYFEAVPKPEKVQNLDDLAPVIELYHHMVRAGKLDEAGELFNDQLDNALYYQIGAYQLYTELLRALFLDGEDKPPRLKREDAQAWALNGLANSYSLCGQPRRAVAPFTNAISLYEKDNEGEGHAIVLGNLAYMAQIHIGALEKAKHNLLRSAEIAHEIGEDFWEAAAHTGLGRLSSFCGLWTAAEKEYEKSIDTFMLKGEIQYASVVTTHYALHCVLTERDPRFSPRNLNKGLLLAQRALKLAEEMAQKHTPHIRDFVRAHWLLGSIYRIDKQIDLAERHLSEALIRDRAINLVEVEADILLDLARLRYDQKKYEEAKSLADEALLITERCGYVLQGADVNLFLAQYALEQEKDKAKAKGYAEEALKLATCDGPPYYYKVAYEEAERFLEKL